MIDLLSRRRDKLFCDECLRRLLHGSHLRCIADTADAVGMAAGFRRLKGILRQLRRRGSRNEGRLSGAPTRCLQQAHDDADSRRATDQRWPRACKMFAPLLGVAGRNSEHWENYRECRAAHDYAGHAGSFRFWLRRFRDHNALADGLSPGRLSTDCRPSHDHDLRLRQSEGRFDPQQFCRPAPRRSAVDCPDDGGGPLHYDPGG